MEIRTDSPNRSGLHTCLSLRGTDCLSNPADLPIVGSPLHRNLRWSRKYAVGKRRSFTGGRTMLLNTFSTASTSSVVAHFALTTVALSAGTASCSRSLHRRHERWLRHQSGRCWNKPSRCRTAGCRMSMGHLHRQCAALLNQSRTVISQTVC